MATISPPFTVRHLIWDGADRWRDTRRYRNPGYRNPDYNPNLEASYVIEGWCPCCRGIAAILPMNIESRDIALDRNGECPDCRCRFSASMELHPERPIYEEDGS